MIDRGKRGLLGVLIDGVDYDAALERILRAAEAPEPYGVSALAVHGVMTGALDPEQRYRLNHLELVVPDGQPVRWGLNWLYGLGLTERVYGPELTLRTCREAARRGIPIYLYGSRPEVLDRLRAGLQGAIPDLRIAGAEPSRFRQLEPREQEELVERIRASSARIVFAGLGCPRQEVFAYELREALAMPVLAVGAAFDFHAGTLEQAPEWMGRHGLEWLYRLSREPRRLAHRYLVLNPLYLSMLVAQKLRLRRFDPSDVEPPADALRYG